MRLKNASYSEFSITNTQVSGNTREHANKVSNANVYGTRYNGNKLFARFHTVKKKVTGSYTATIVGTRLNAQKYIFWGVYMRFWKILSAWGVSVWEFQTSTMMWHLRIGSSFDML
jgi:hypothetical protein